MKHTIRTSNENVVIRGSIHGIVEMDYTEDSILWYFREKKYADHAMKVFSNTFEYVQRVAE